MNTATPDAPPVTAQRLLACTATDLAAHQALLGPVPYRGAAGLLVDTLEAAGLTGRGGAGFPTWRKVRSTAAATGRGAVVIGNGSEGEPASGKDAALLVAAPHLVLDGLQLAAEAVAAQQVHLHVKAGPAARAVQRALAERSGSDRYPVTLHEAATSFVAGEESAVISAIEGGPALPRTKRFLVTERGLDGRPTLVQNVETLAHVALIARYGADWFRQAGTAAEPGTFLATVGGAVRAPGVVEAGYGVPLGALLEAAGGPARQVGAVLVGGYHGAWVPGHAVATTPMSRAGLAPWGAIPGAGVLWVLPAGDCGLVASASITSYLARQSARQCGPCAFGLPALAEDLERLAAPLSAHAAGAPLANRIAALAGIVDGRGACRHPDGTVRLVRSALRTFADDVHAHLSGRCLAA